MRARFTNRAIRGGILILSALWLTIPSLASAQSSTNFALSPGVAGAGGASSSTGFGLVGSAGGIQGRSSSTGNDAVSGFVGGAFSSQATTSVTTTAGSYLPVGWPVNASSNTVASILDELGSYNNTQWRLGHWSPADSAYMEPNAGAPLTLSTVAVGQGYWLITKNAATVAATGLPAPTLPFTIALAGRTGTPERPAWNQISNPFLFPVAVSALLVQSGATTIALTNAGNTFTEQVVKGWTGSAYVDATVLNGRTAYWVKKKVTAAVNLIIPYQASATGIPEPNLAKPADATWALAISARQGERSCEPLMLGATSLAPGPWNPLNLSKAPAPPGGEFLSLGIPKSDWGALSGEYVREFQPQAERMTWEFVTSGARAPGEVTLELTGFDVPAGTRFLLSDAQGGWSREVTPGEAITLTATEAPKRYRIEAAASGGFPAGSGLTDGLRFVYPNPFAASAGLAFTLARGGDLEVGIFDVMGRRVRDLSRTGAGPGDHVIVWDGRDAGGRSVASGLYFARYRAGADAGVRRLIKVE